MKMKQLRERLKARGSEVSERMIKYYIEIDLLPEPEYTGVNQADYCDIHIIRLLKICALKDMGTPFSQIKEILASDNRILHRYAEEHGISNYEAARSSEVYIKEYTDYCFNYANTNRTYSAKELMEDIGCEKLVFEIAVDTGLIAKKESYSHNDMLILICVANIFSQGENAESNDIIEKISEISKINNIATQLAGFYAKGDSSMWLYKNLTESIIRGKLENLCKQNKV